jgi:hypothetical protein
VRVVLKLLYANHIFVDRPDIGTSWCSSSCMRHTGLQIEIEIYFDLVEAFLFLLGLAPQHFTPSRVLSRDQLYPCQLWRYKRRTVVYLARTLDRYTRPISPPRSHHLLTMTVVSNDPSFWPLIDLQILYSYWIGL